MKKLYLALLMVFAALTAGCNDFSTPEGVAAAAYKAVKRSDLTKFRKALATGALRKYGSRAGLKTLQAKLKPYRRIRTRNLTQIKPAMEDGPGRFQRLYTLDIEGEHTKLFTATIACVTELRGPGRHPAAQGDEIRRSSECWITELK